MIFGSDTREPHTITIKTGHKKEHLGKSGDGLLPMFFGVDKHENIYIPDPERNRIAIYDSQGIFLQSIDRIESISHRMNYFDMTPDGSFIIYSDSTLYLLNDKGKILWNIPFPLGFLPSDILIQHDSVVMQFTADKSKKMIVKIPYFEPETFSFVEFMPDEPVYIESDNKMFSWSNNQSADNSEIITYPQGNGFSKVLNIQNDGYTVWFESYIEKTNIVILSCDLEIVSTHDISSLSLNDGKWHQIRFFRNGSKLYIFDFTTDKSLIKIKKLYLVDFDVKANK